MEHAHGSGHVIGNRSGDTCDYDQPAAHERLHRQLLDEVERNTRRLDATQVRLHTSVPVSIVVNLDTATVERVIVEDELLEQPSEAYTAGSGQHLSMHGAAVRAAVEILDDADWPAWQFGW